MIAAVEGFGGAVMQLRAATAAGGFSITEEGAQPLLKAVADLRLEVAQHLIEAGHLTQQLPLGQTPAAAVYKPFIASVAADQTQGLVPYLRKLQHDLNDVEDSINKAVSLQRGSDHAGASTIKRSGS